MEDDPYEKFNKLAKAIDRVAEANDLTREAWTILPDKREIVVTFKVSPEILLSLSEKEQLQFDESFSKLISGFDGEPEPEVDPAQAELNKIRKTAEELLDDDDFDYGD